MQVAVVQIHRVLSQTLRKTQQEAKESTLGEAEDSPRLNPGSRAGASRDKMGVKGLWSLLSPVARPIK